MELVVSQSLQAVETPQAMSSLRPLPPSSSTSPAPFRIANKHSLILNSVLVLTMARSENIEALKNFLRILVIFLNNLRV